MSNALQRSRVFEHTSLTIQYTKLGLDFLDLVAILRVQPLDLLAEVLFDLATNRHRCIRVDHIDCDAVLAESAGATDPMQIRLAVGLTLLVDGQIEVHD